MAKKLPTQHRSKLDKFQLGYEYDKTIHQVRREIPARVDITL